MRYFLALLSAALALSVRAQLQAPIPLLNRDPGIIYGNGSLAAQIKLEAYLEINCPDSAAAWPTLREVAEHYSGTDVAVVIHQLPLPYHRNAFICTQAFYCIAELDPRNAWDFFTDVLNNWRDFSTSNTVDKSENEIVDNLAGIVERTTDIHNTTFRSELSKYRSHTTRTWKHGVRRSVAGTPWYFINGIDLAENPSGRINFDTWKVTLDSLLGITSLADNGPYPTSSTAGTTPRPSPSLRNEEEKQTGKVAKDKPSDNIVNPQSEQGAKTGLNDVVPARRQSNRRLSTAIADRLKRVQDGSN